MIGIPAKGAVAAGHAATAEAAAFALREGGNAFDAAIAAHWTACVAEPVLTSIPGQHPRPHWLVKARHSACPSWQTHGESCGHMLGSTGIMLNNMLGYATGNLNAVVTGGVVASPSVYPARPTVEKHPPRA